MENGILKTKILRKITEVPPEEWNSVFPEVLESYQFFKTLDESNFEQFSFYYILVYDHNALVGAAPCFLMHYPLDTTVGGPLKSICNAIKRIFPNLFDLKAVICGLPMGQGRIGVRGESKRVVQAISECMKQIAKKEKTNIVAFKDFGVAYTDSLNFLSGHGFSRFENLPSTDMEIRFNDFDSYLKTLSRASRDGLKRKLKKTTGLVKIDLEISDNLNGSLQEVYELYLQTVSKAETQFEMLPIEFFDRISQNMSAKIKYFMWRIDQKLVAFALCLVSNDHFIDYYLGFDYSVAFDYHLYFIRFRDLLKWCIEHKMKTYEMGPTTYEPKRRLGFDFIPLYLYVKHLNRWIDPLFKLLCHILKPENFHPVFKEMSDRKQ